MSDRYDALCAVTGPVSRETFERLLAFEAIFRKWAGRINLAAPSTIPELWERHILDSAQLFSIKPQAKAWLDIGSGGGFPGAVMAILLAERAGSRIALVESNRKKTAFLQAALGDVGVRADILGCRIEDAPARVGFQPVVVTARALALLAKLIDLSFPWLERGAVGLFHKGREYRAELAQTAPAWSFHLVEHPSRIGPDGVILEIANPRRVNLS